VHHVLVHECDYDFEEAVPTAQECGDVMLSDYVATKCTNKLLFVWGVGRNPVFTFPKQAGYPIYKQARSHIHFMLEIHYDNPRHVQNLVDSSTVRFHFTKSLREYELGLMELGSDTPLSSPLNLLLPPKQKEVTFRSVCYPECTKNFIPNDGITLLNIFFHSHLTGRKMKTYLVRDGVIIKYIRDNPWYDFNHQNVLDLETIKIYPGDALITECTFDTSDRTNFTFWGFSSRLEMCNSNLYYYPLRRNMNDCNSHNTHKALYDFHRSLMQKGMIPYFELDETNQQTQHDSNNRIVEFLWSKDLNYTAELEKEYVAYVNGKHDQDMTCWNRMWLNESLYKIPMKYFQPTGDTSIKPEEVCKGKSSSSMTKYSIAMISFLSLVSIFVS